MLRHALWRQAFEAELLTFPAGRHDDQVDALGLVGQLLNQMACGPAPKVKKPASRDGYSWLFEERSDRRDYDWKVGYCRRPVQHRATTVGRC